MSRTGAPHAVVAAAGSTTAEGPSVTSPACHTEVGYEISYLERNSTTYNGDKNRVRVPYEPMGRPANPVSRGCFRNGPDGPDGPDGSERVRRLRAPLRRRPAMAITRCLWR